jgi:hypothetical protein
VEGDRGRWFVEAYHQCLKTSGGIEARQLHTAARFMHLLGLFLPMAVRRLQRRDVARRARESAAAPSVEPAAVALMAARTSLPPEHLSAATFWREVARLGGHLARTRDGPPGWKTLWQGWLYRHPLMEDPQLAAHLGL